MYGSVVYSYGITPEMCGKTPTKEKTFEIPDDETFKNCTITLSLCEEHWNIT
jgi:hypothetical protein